MQLDPGNIDLGELWTVAFSPDGKQLLAGGLRGAAFWSAAPIVWNDPVRAAESLRLLLQSNADFQSRIRMLSEHTRLDEALEKLEKLTPDDGRVQVALAVTRARRFTAQGNAALADAARTKARLLLEQKLGQEPENLVWAAELADLLLADGSARWTVLEPVEAKSELGATLSILPDHSILASGANPLNDRYRVVLTVATDIDLTAVCLEALTHPSLPGNGPGRNPLGSFAQTSWNVTAASRDRKEPIRLPFDSACADDEIPGYPMTASGHWNIARRGEEGATGGSCTAVWSLSKPVSLAAGTMLTFQMQFQEWNGIGENLGRFRLSVSADSAVFARFAAMQLADPWAKLAAAYQSAGRTREGVPYLAKASPAKPQDAMLFLKVAALQAWFGQDKEQSATRQRLLAFAKGTEDAPTCERVAKACSILPCLEKAELEATLTLARKGAELVKGRPGQEWNLLSLGMAEYRSGNYAAAIEAQLAAANAGAGNAIVSGISEFYRAMSLFRQGKADEARKLAIAAEASMKPLPKDEQNPFADGAYYDDLILWLAYKEAKAVIQFDAAPTNPATPDGK